MQRPSPAKDERGFILVTAVMFVLILSILGASLLSHGPLENSLVIDRTNNSQAFYYAEAGIDRALAALARATYLDEAKLNRPPSVSTQRVPLIRAIQYRPSLNDTVSSETFPRALILFSGSDAGEVTIETTGSGAGFAGYLAEARTIKQTFLPIPAPPYDDLCVSTGRTGTGFQLANNDTLIGKLIVSNNPDSVTLVSYSRGTPIPTDSVRVNAGVGAPDFTGFINQKIANGYIPISADSIVNSSSIDPYRLGIGGSIYYSATNLNPPVGHTGYLQIYGLVYVLVHGQFTVGKELDIERGNSTAALVVVTDYAGSQEGLQFYKLAFTSDVPVVMLTSGDIDIKFQSHFETVSFFGRVIKLADGCYMRYNHAVLDPFISSLMNTPGGFPITQLNGQRGQLKAKLGSWSEQNPAVF